MSHTTLDPKPKTPNQTSHRLRLVAMSAPSRDNSMQLVAASSSSGGGGTGKELALVDEGAAKARKVLLREDEEDLEVKLRRIMEHVPVRVSNTSGSSAGSGSGDFHQYRQMRRKEQDRVARMDADYQKRLEIAEFNLRREERLKAAERTAKKRQKRQKKKDRRKDKKKSKLDTITEEEPKKDGEPLVHSDDSSDDDDE
ncbi:PRKR interacting protein 1 [Rhynchospora pubera]|uniref:PRKR interacting protein 1 n=1 Tax=Rhynchospora pubera TaxID=906938 RepID=A0AAV8FLN1_9POAL|nr:PRKR interacting protein 1 [Rhynchospora pubera]